jgi:hypothetical protein
VVRISRMKEIGFILISCHSSGMYCETKLITTFSCIWFQLNNFLQLLVFLGLK